MTGDSGAVPMFPTCAPPGSRAKMVIMRLRVIRGESLHHPSDNQQIDPNLINPFSGERAYSGDDLDTGLDIVDVA